MEKHIEPHASPRYANEILAWEYDQRQPSPFSGELEWYLKYIKQAGCPVLELTCGSGRLTIPIAQAGYEIDGVDSSPTMLRRLTEKLEVYSESVRGKIRTFYADVLDFVPDRSYPAVLLPYNSLQYLETKERIAALFSRVSTFLLRGGFFLFTMRRINITDYANGEKTTFDRTDRPVVDERSPSSVAPKVVSSHDPLTGRIANHEMYIIRRGDGSERIIDFTTYTPVITTVEYVRMLENAEFVVQEYSGYNDLPDDGVSKEICFVCKK